MDISYDRVTDDIVLDGDGDLVFTSDTNLTEGIRQDVVATLKTFAGEWFLDNGNNVGVDWIGQILSVSPVDYAKADQLVRGTIQRIAGISSVVSIEFDLERSDRKLDITFVALTNNGATIQDNIQV